MAIQTQSREALREMIDLLQQVDQRWAGPEWNIHSEEDVAHAHRSLMHILEGGLSGFFESDAANPLMRRIVTPSRKFTGDNPDAIYFDAPVSPDYEYLLRGNMNGAIYVSITIEVGAEDGSLASRTGGVINDTEFDVDSDGRFAIRLGGSADTRNWLALSEGASRITTRHYYEEALSAAGNPERQPVLSIEVLNRPALPPPPSDDSIARGIRRATQFVRSRTLDMPPMMTREPVPFLSLQPNTFPQPVPPGDFGLAAFDASYSMAPYVLGPDDALVITGRWPRCRCANVCLWTRHQQTFDYLNRPVSLNRAQTQLQPDGSFRMVLAHRDPGVANWIDTEGRPYGLVFWRFMLAEGEIETPRAEVVPFATVSD